MIDKIIKHLVNYLKANYEASLVLRCAIIGLLLAVVFILFSSIDLLAKIAFLLAGAALMVMLGFEYVYAVPMEDDDESSAITSDNRNDTE